MRSKVYVSASRSFREKLARQKVTKHQIIYTDDLEDADFIIIEKQTDDTLADAQFRDLVRARELGIKVDYIKEGPELERVQAMKDTRKKFDLEIE